MLEDVVEELLRFGARYGLLDKKILLMFSGGKDSSLGLLLLKRAGFNVSAITFFHKWSWKETLNWAMGFTKRLGVEHYLVDITEGLLSESIGKKGPICIHCKRVMMWNAFWFARNNGFDVLAKGDNANDKIIGALLDQCSGDIRLCEIPRVGLPILRPLIYYTAKDVEKMAEEVGIQPYRMYEYGRRRQWREGCPLQYIDREETITKELVDLAYRMNYEVSKIARKRKVRVSVRVPSFEIMAWDPSEGTLEDVKRTIEKFKR